MDLGMSCSIPASLGMSSVIPVLLGATDLLTKTYAAAAAFWSLTCEVIYYIVAPWFKRTSLIVLHLAYAVSLLACAFHVSLYVHGHYGTAALDLAWIWLTGWLYERSKRSRLAFLYLAVPPILLGASVPLVTTILVLVVCRRLLLDKRIAAVGIYLGNMSYALYATHLSVFCLLILALPKFFTKEP